MFKVSNNKDTRTTPERRHWHRSGVFIVNFEHISHRVIMFLLLTLNMSLPARFNPFYINVIFVVFRGYRNKTFM